MNHAGKNLYVPRTTDKERGIMDLLQIFGEDDLQALPRGLWGIREPEREYMGTLRPTGESALRARPPFRPVHCR